MHFFTLYKNEMMTVLKNDIKRYGFDPVWYITDDTNHWSESVRNHLKSGNKLYSIYLADLSTAVNCCEVTPSCECELVAFATTDIDDFDRNLRDQIVFELSERQDEPLYIHYVNVKDGGLPVNLDALCNLSSYFYDPFEKRSRQSVWYSIVKTTRKYFQDAEIEFMSLNAFMTAWRQDQAG